MKTYKQKYYELWYTILNLKDELVKQNSLAFAYKQMLEKEKLIDPIEHEKLKYQFNQCISALEAIEILERMNRKSETKSMAEAIANEVLHQVGRK